jgi:6-phosphofructokinase 1
MNAAVRAVVRTGIAEGMEMFGVRYGFQGLIDDTIKPLTNEDVSGILHHGGTMLGTARSREFKQEEPARRRALANLERRSVDALIVIGGNGSQAGSTALHRMGFRICGVASTVDNDIYGSDLSIGVDTALDIALESIDRIRTTAESHKRAFLVEVMGRQHGYLALVAGITGGADLIVTPEHPLSPEEITGKLRSTLTRGVKNYALAVITDGVYCGKTRCSDVFREKEWPDDFDVKVTILGHVQRGGIPNSSDRLLASRLGAAAIELLNRGDAGKLIGTNEGKLVEIPLEEVDGRTKPLDEELWRLSQIL